MYSGLSKFELPFTDEEVFFVETVEGGTASGIDFVNEFCLLDERHLVDALAEIALVEFLVQNGFVERLQLCEREEFRQQLESHGTVGNVFPQELEGSLDHAVVVKEQLWERFHILPVCRMLMIEFFIDLVNVEQRHVSHGDDAVSGVAVYTAEGADLSHIDTFKSCEFLEDTTGCIVQIFLGLDKPTHQ